MRLMALGRMVVDLDDWYGIRLIHRVLVALFIIGALFVAGEIFTLGRLVITPPESVDLTWFNVYFESATQASGALLQLLGFIWVLSAGTAYIVFRRLELLVIPGFLVQSLFTAQLSPLVMLDFHGLSFTASTLYWVMSGALVLTMPPSGFVSPLRINDRAWQAVLVFVAVGLIGLLWGLARGNSGLFQFANYLQFAIAFYLAYSMVTTGGPFLRFLPVLLIAGAFKAFWGYGLLINNAGLREASGWGALGISTPALSILVFPLLIGVLVTVGMGSYGAIRIKSRSWAIVGGFVLPAVTVLPVILSAQRSHWASLVVVLFSVSALLTIVPFRFTAVAITVVFVGTAVLAVPAYMPVLLLSKTEDVAPTAVPTTGPSIVSPAEPREEPEPVINSEVPSSTEPVVVPTPTPRVTLDGTVTKMIYGRIDHTLREFQPGSGYTRVQDIENAVSAFKRNPLFGDGLGVHYFYTFDPRGDRLATEGELNPSFHLSIVGIVATTGAAGLLAVLSVFFIPILRAIRLVKGNDGPASDRVMVICAISALLGALTYFTVDQWFPHSARTPVIAVIMGGTVGLIRWYELRNDQKAKHENAVISD